jgi:hypothetical protein
MSPLRTIARDLLERRLWPFAALLAIGLVAVPVVFLRPAPSAVSETPAPAPAATPAAGAAATPAAPATAPGDPTADPSVSLTSSPFAAAFAGPLDLPPSMQGLLKATKGADQRRAVADAPLRDPFASGVAQATPDTAAAAPAAPRAEVYVKRPAMDVPASTPAVPGPSAPAETPSTPSTPATPKAADTTPSTPAPAAEDWRVFRTDVSFGTTDSAPQDTDALRLTAYPSSFNPVAIFLGVMRGGWGAAFMLRDDVRPIGAPSCRPRKSICTWVILHPGESVTLSAKDAATGTVTAYKLELSAIREDKVAEEAALAANAKADASGRCLLGPLAAYHYDAQTGTLAPRPELKDCRYDSDNSDATAPAAAGERVAQYQQLP